MLRVLSVFGTRPETIKLAPVIRALAEHSDCIVSRVCVTAQHRGMLDQMLRQFAITPHYDLNVMTSGQSPVQVVSRILARLESVVADERPDWVLVQGDTTTTLAAALAAKYAGACVAHVEAGLRTFDRHQPFPEELNRVAVSRLADLHFAPTPRAKANLVQEGTPEALVLVTGNTGIDALRQTLAAMDPQQNGDPWSHLPHDHRVLLMTAHRRENLGEPLHEICQAMQTIAARYEDRLHIFCPVHPKPEVRQIAHGLLGKTGNVRLMEPLDYPQLVRLMVRSQVVITDSGGIQEEAPYLGKPVLVLRSVTERPEALDAGVAMLVGNGRRRIVAEAVHLLDDPGAYRRMARPLSPFGDGHAAERIVNALLGHPVPDWVPQAIPRSVPISRASETSQ